MNMNGYVGRKPYSTRRKAVRTPENIRKIKNSTIRHITYQEDLGKKLVSIGVWSEGY